jgi:hypothetical protein
MSSRYPEIQWSVPRPYTPSQKPYNAFTLNFLWDLSLVGYVSTEQAALFYGASVKTIRRHLTFWHKKGLIQGAWVSYRQQRARIWTIAPGGVELLRDEDDTTWELLHPHWVSFADQHRTWHTVEHNLDRTTAALLIAKNAGSYRLDADWDKTFTRMTAATPTVSVYLKPDAAIWVNGHPWFIELERSWRNRTLLHKLTQYDHIAMHGLWRQIPQCNEPPKLLLIPTEANTQKRNFQSWITTFRMYQHSYVWVWPWDHVLKNDFTIYGGDGDTKLVSRNFWKLNQAPAYPGKLR